MCSSLRTSITPRGWESCTSHKTMSKCAVDQQVGFKQDADADPLMQTAVSLLVLPDAHRGHTVCLEPVDLALLQHKPPASTTDVTPSCMSDWL